MVNTPVNRYNSMTYWYPILLELQHRLNNPVGEVVSETTNGKFSLKHLPAKDPGFKLRVPDTIFVNYPYGPELGYMADGERPRGLEYLTAAIDLAAQQFGYPVFIRTEQSSDKHSWKDTCYLTAKKDIEQHIYGLLEHSMMAGWPHDFFAIRRLIPTTPICTAFYGDMPVAKERRLFINKGEVVCNHPYWPDEAFTDGEGNRRDNVTDEQIAELQVLSEADKEQLTRAAEWVSKHIYGYWSIDFLQDSNGDWWCIDMAIGSNSYHWPDCPNKVQD